MIRSPYDFLAENRTLVTTVQDLTIVEKSQLDFNQRLKSAFKAQSFMPWSLALFMIVTGIMYDDRIKGIILITIAICYVVILTNWAYRIAKTYIVKIDDSDAGTIITYLRKDMLITLTLSTDQNLFRTIDKSRYTLKQIHILDGEKTIIKQYAFGPWDEKQIQEVESQLTRIGFKKPFGENL